jgi:hypothetical protein
MVYVKLWFFFIISLAIILFGEEIAEWLSKKTEMKNKKD